MHGLCFADPSGTVHFSDTSNSSLHFSGLLLYLSYASDNYFTLLVHLSGTSRISFIYLSNTSRTITLHFSYFSDIFYAPLAQLGHLVNSCTLLLHIMCTHCTPFGHFSYHSRTPVEHLFYTSLKSHKLLGHIFL